MEGAIELTLTPAEIALLVDALDAYEYWLLGDILPRNNGAVFVPGDMLEDDRFWGDSAISPTEAHAIEQVRESRRLARRLMAAGDAKAFALDQ